MHNLLNSFRTCQSSAYLILEMKPKFIIDVNVGRLAKWLRAMGYDAAFVPDVDDGDLLAIAHSEGRIVLSRDRRLSERRLVTSGSASVLCLRSDKLLEQLRQAVGEFNLSASEDFLRSIECNVELRGLDAEQAEDRVPIYVFQTQEMFKECPRCLRVYWRGTHWQNMRRDLKRALGESG